MQITSTTESTHLCLCKPESLVTFCPLQNSSVDLHYLVRSWCWSNLIQTVSLEALPILESYHKAELAISEVCPDMLPAMTTLPLDMLYLCVCVCTCGSVCVPGPQGGQSTSEPRTAVRQL